MPLRTIIWHSALEFFLTFALLFSVVTFVRWVIGPSAVSRAIPDIHLQLLIIGTAVALLVAGLILSPAGRTSGGHMNPAISTHRLCGPAARPGGQKQPGHASTETVLAAALSSSPGLP